LTNVFVSFDCLIWGVVGWARAWLLMVVSRLLIKSVLLNDMQFEQGTYLLRSVAFLRCPGWRGGQVLGME
jgi:hypothetical protein